MRNLIAFALGVMFAIGLGVSGMTDPAVVVGFLDFTGNWNPTLLFVMAAAVPIHMLAWFGRHARGATLDASAFPAPRHDLDWQLFLGASLFRIGWGLAGVCPGPAVTILLGEVKS
jgi:uncharacterized protein